jgi:NAD(P)H-quinone oxidoreductase subunit 4
MLLSAAVWVPIVGAIVIAILSPKYSRITAIVTAFLGFLITLTIGINFHLDATGWQLAEKLTWIEPLGLDYQLAIDGLALPLVVMNGLLVLLAIFATDPQIERPRLFYILVLFLSTAVTGAFVAQNLLLFFLFYELELIPLYLLIAIWGGERRGYAATKFLIYQALSGILILAAFLSWAWFTKADNFSYSSLQSSTLPDWLRITLLTTILIGFGVKMPLVPFHTWLPDAYVAAPTPVSMLLGGIVSKLGTYGLIRFAFGLFPDTWPIVAPWLAVVAAITALYGSFVAIAQTDMKQMVAYSSVAHISYILLATAAGTELSFVGALTQMVAHGTIVALLFAVVGTIEAKTGTRDIRQLSGLMNPQRGLPVTAALLILAIMASAGIPGGVGFVGEYLAFQGSYSVYPIATILSIVSTALTSVYFIILCNNTLLGKLPLERQYLPKVTWIERLPALVLAAAILWFGIQPNNLLQYTNLTSIHLASLPHHQPATTTIANK